MTTNTTNGPDALKGAVSKAVQIRDYVNAQAALGRHVTYADAAAHLEMQEKHPNSLRATADRISAYVDEQATRGIRVSFSEAAAHVEAELPALKNEAPKAAPASNHGNTGAAPQIDPVKMAAEIRDYMDDEAKKGNVISTAQAATFVELKYKRKS